MSKNNILKRLSPIHLVALICAVVIFATVVVSSIFYIRNEVKDAKREFDYTKETLTDYITLGDYENLTVAPEYNKLRAVDVKSNILTLKQKRLSCRPDCAQLRGQCQPAS